jgi:tRNA pseudouridine55 synthase
MKGLLVIDKPGGMTSRDVVNRVQRWFPKGTKIGHTGTLDPLATGVLVVCVGAATRLADLVQGMGKTYRSRFRLGARSDTDDADGTVTPGPGAAPPTEDQVKAALDTFVGEIEQVPPAYSALKVSGVRAHDLARRGKEVPLAPRTVRVDAVRLLAYDWPFADVEIDCGKGTYIRSIARDLGNKLACGGLVETLRRTRVGPFTVEQGIGVDASPEEVRTRLLPMAAAVAHLPHVVLDDGRVWKFVNGQLFDARDVLPRASIGCQLAVVNHMGNLVGIAVQHEGGTIRPVVVFRT